MIPYLDDWLIHHPDRKVLLRRQAQLMNMLDLVGFVVNRKKSELDLTQNIQLGGGRSGGPQGDSRLTDFYLWESHCVCRLGARTDRHNVFVALEPGLTDCPPFSVGFWNNPNCHMNYLDYL